MKKEITIGNKIIGEGYPAYVVADAGVNHKCHLSWAKRLVKEAALAGADAIKFQSYKAGKIAAKDSPIYWNDKNVRTQYDAFQVSDCFGEAEFVALFDHCEEWGIEFMSTPFDADAVRYLDQLGMNIYKVASADLTNHIMLNQIADIGKPVLLSTGAATLEEIKDAVRIFESKNTDVVLLHCVLDYPTSDGDANLKEIVGLQKAFPNYLIGYSDHTIPGEDLLVPAVAVALGAKVIEKHFTLNVNFSGEDHYHSVDPYGLRKVIASVRRTEKLLGCEEVGLVAAEEKARRFARRSLVARGMIRQGEVISMENVIPKRPGTGISPTQIGDVLGRKAKVNIDDDIILAWDMLE